MSAHVLLVEDEVNMAKTQAKILQRKGYEVDTACNGREALHLLDRAAFDVVITDLKMPVMDGKQFLAMMRGNPRLQTIPVVIMSAATREWSGAHLEVEEVLTKPVDLEVLLTTVNRICAPRL